MVGVCSSGYGRLRVSDNSLALYVIWTLTQIALAFANPPPAFGPDIAPPGLQSVWGELTPMVSSAMEGGETELEVRFGMEPGGFPSHGFPNGVPPDAFERVADALRASAAEGNMECLSERWELQRDLCYSTFLRESMSASGERKVLRKQLIKRIDVVGQGGDPSLATHAPQLSQGGEVKMRFSWKTEQNVLNPTAEDFGQLDGVREKQRLSFRYKMWRFDLTVVRGAPCYDFSQIDAALQTAQTTYEVELELEAHRRPPQCPPAYLAHSLLLKAQDITALLLPAPSPRPAFSLLQHHRPAAAPAQHLPAAQAV